MGRPRLVRSVSSNPGRVWGFALFVFLDFFVPFRAFLFFVGLLFLNWHFGPSQLSAVTANSDQLSYLTSWG